ncbi:pyruvate dehydrogenase E1 component beta subunit [Streptomyces sp. PvR006]|uniref:alpha-ketoacid dehydrogenase subunit beta n=1 Tax=Streptomyces sp. PvR006 TaxID=2817860 RepID=UPI0035AB817A|nr:pyruvate dehydrogenase E1 component beta subunit [Streptomyces sp. PvR006]
MAATMVEAINTALREAMAEDERVVVFGQDVARQGGVFRVTEGLAERFGPQRCFDTPLAESAIVGVALGMAMRGLRPVPEIQFDGFTYPALDQIVSHLAKYRNRTRGGLSVPVTLRVPSFGGIGAVEHHSESTETFWVHTAGLRVVTPATAADAHVLLRQSIDCDDPVIFLEPKRRYWQSGDETAEAPAARLDQALVRRSGTDVTVVAYGGTVGTALEAAETARREHGWELEVVDLRSLAPLDLPTIAASVSRTGRCVVLHEGPRTLGLGAEIAARVQEELFWDLEAPVLRVTGFDTPYPPARWEKAWLPGVDRLLDGIERSFGYSHD